MAVAAALGLASLVAAPRALAFNYGSAITPPCHEQMTVHALRSARADLPAARPIAPNRNERALIEDVPFDLDADMRDLGAVSLLLGVRDNDLKGRAATELDQLALVHGDPASQREHCLRPPSADEPGGSETALRDCRAFIAERVQQALDALDAAGAPDPGARTELAVDLQLRGRVDASLPTFYVKLGQALHALQDGFSHTFRTADGKRVTVVLDWFHFVDGTHDERRDGPAHQRDLDTCDDADALRARNRRLAVEASTELVRITLDASKTRAEKTALVDDLLARNLSFEPGCSETNRWCDAPENAYADAAGCGCGQVGTARGSAAAGIAALAIAAAALYRRKRRLAAVGGAVLLLLPASANAQENAPPLLPPPATPEERERLAKEAEHQASTFALAAGYGGSIVDPGMAANVGARLRLTDRWVVGLDGELNWWYGVQTSTLRAGAANVYASLVARFPMRLEPLNLRSTLQLGTSVQMLDLYGVPRGSVGLFAGLYPLGIEWKVSRALYVILQPLGVAVPAPQLTGAPFAYLQFRTTLGLELAF